jgi:hypothetical protein
MMTAWSFFNWPDNPTNIVPTDEFPVDKDVLWQTYSQDQIYQMQRMWEIWLQAGSWNIVLTEKSVDLVKKPTFLDQIKMWYWIKEFELNDLACHRRCWLEAQHSDYLVRYCNHYHILVKDSNPWSPNLTREYVEELRKQQSLQSNNQNVKTTETTWWRIGTSEPVIKWSNNWWEPKLTGSTWSEPTERVNNTNGDGWINENSMTENSKRGNNKRT